MTSSHAKYRPGLASVLGQPVVVDNRPGIFPAQIVARAAPDGYTLQVAGGATWIVPMLQKVPYDVLQDFTPTGRDRQAAQPGRRARAQSSGREGKIRECARRSRRQLTRAIRQHDKIRDCEARQSDQRRKHQDRLTKAATRTAADLPKLINGQHARMCARKI